MKKYIPIFMAIIVGIIFGNLIFDSYKSELVMSNDGSVYMLQYGAYTNENVMKENVKNLNNKDYVIEKVNDIYYVYLGITANYYNAINILEIYKEKGVFLYIKENYLGKSSLINKIKENDLLIKDENNTELIINYVKDSLSLYEKEMWNFFVFLFNSSILIM